MRFQRVAICSFQPKVDPKFMFGFVSQYHFGKKAMGREILREDLIIPRKSKFERRKCSILGTNEMSHC